jgi:hypothetical protein
VSEDKLRAELEAQQKAAQIAALLRERQGYEARGENQRAAAVTAELRRLGAEAAPPAKRAQRRQSTN